MIFKRILELKQHLYCFVFMSFLKLYEFFSVGSGLMLANMTPKIN